MLLIIVASTVIGVLLDYNVSETIEKYRTAIEDHYLLFTTCFVVLAILLSQLGVSLGVILGCYVAISNSIFSLLLAFISIIVSGVISLYGSKNYRLRVTHTSLKNGRRTNS